MEPRYTLLFPTPPPSPLPPVPSRPVLTWFSLWVVDLVTSLACAVGLMSVCLVVYPSASCCMRTQEPFPGLTLPPLCSEGWSSGEGGGEVTLSPTHTHRSHTHTPPPAAPTSTEAARSCRLCRCGAESHMWLCVCVCVSCISDRDTV